MTQHPFDREYSEQEAQKLNSESTAPVNKDELTDEEAEDVAGGKDILPPFTARRFEGGIKPSPINPIKPITDGKFENGGPWIRD